MKPKLRMRKTISVLMAFLLIFTAVLPLSSGITKAMAATGWQPIGNSTIGLNVDATNETSHPNMVNYNNELYMAWSERADQDNKVTIQIKKYNGSSWEYVDGGTSFSADPLATATNPVMAVFQNELYVTWYESSNKGNQIRVKKYDGSSWSFVDGGGSKGLNMNSPAIAYIPHLIVYNNNLFIVWVENTNGNYQIRVKKHNGSSWEWVDGGSNDGLNASPSSVASNPESAIYNGNLYISWNESSGGKSQLRVKKFDGTTWSFIDGSNGLGSDSSDISNGSLTVFNNELFAVFSEKNGVHTHLRVKKYDGVSWTSVDGANNAGLNVNVSKNAKHSRSAVYDNALYVIWTEAAGAWGGTIHIKKYDGTNWSGTSETILNVDPSSPTAMNPSLSSYNGKLFAAWTEYNNYQTQIRVKQYDGVTWMSAHNEINVGLNGNLIHSYHPDLKEFNNALYAIWVETGKIVVKSYSNGVLSTISDPEGLNVDPTKEAETPKLAVFNNELFALWVERDNANVRILRVKKWDGMFWVDDKNGLNVDSQEQALHPNLLSTNDAIYVAWSESSSVGYGVHVKKFDGSWESLGRAASHTANNPSLAMFQSELYGTWLELNSANHYQPRIKKYNGQDWVYVDNGGVNESVDSDNSNTSIIEFNKELYVVWVENGTNGALLRVKRFNGASWVAVENIATDIALLDSPPALKVFRNTLFATWTETNGKAPQVRVKQFNGTSWSSADGDGVDGLNVDATKRAFASVLEEYNGELFAAWTEYNGVSNQIRMARYTGNIIPPVTPTDPNTPGSTITLAAPTGFIATPEDGQVNLRWNSVTGATYYQVYQGISSGNYGTAPVVRLNGAANSALITGLSNNISYYFAVQAGNENGVGALSPEVSVVPQVNRKADLQTLALSQGALNPAFDSRILDYTAIVPNSVSSLTVTASVYDHQSPLTVTASVYDQPSSLTVNGALVTSGQESSPIQLAVGQNIISVEVTAANGLKKIYSVNVTRESASPSSGTHPSDSSNWISDPNSGKSTRNQLASSIVTKENGQTVVNVSLDSAIMASQLTNGGDKQTLSIPVSQEADKVSVNLNEEVLKTLDQFKQTVLAISTPIGNIKLPAAQINLNDLSAKFGEPAKASDLSVQVVINKSDSSKEKSVRDAANKSHFTVMAAPVDFSVMVSYKDKTEKIGRFSNFVEREIPIPSGIDPNTVKTAVALNDDGSIRHVPTQIIARNGSSYAVIKSLTNSTYLLISHQKSFDDLQGHWAQGIISDMLSRMVINGVDDTHYAPDAAITRAEFAAIIVQALGMDNKGKTVTFKDVATSDWFNAAVVTAQEYGIIKGYEDGTFRPGKTVTREEAMVMIAKAMQLTDLKAYVNNADADFVLSAFIDGASVGAWAKQGVSAVVSSKLINGAGNGLLPKKDITRAEAAVLVHRMLEKADLIDVVQTK